MIQNDSVIFRILFLKILFRAYTALHNFIFAQMYGHFQSFFLVSGFLAESLKANQD